MGWLSEELCVWVPVDWTGYWHCENGHSRICGFEGMLVWPPFDWMARRPFDWWAQWDAWNICLFNQWAMWGAGMTVIQSAIDGVDGVLRRMPFHWRDWHRREMAAVRGEP